MISETRLKKELNKRLDSYIEKSNSLELKADGYVDCYNDVLDIVENMTEENRIKASARRAVKKLLSSLNQD